MPPATSSTLLDDALDTRADLWSDPDGAPVTRAEARRALQLRDETWIDPETDSVPTTRAEARRALEAQARRTRGRHSHGRRRHSARRRVTSDHGAPAYQPRETLPRFPLLLMAAAGFVTMMTEALPVSVMPSMRASTGWSDGTIGQLVTAYGIGCGAAAIPMTLLTRGIDRRRLVLVTTAVFVVTNLVTPVTTSLPLMLVARVLAGCCAGLLWAILAGYATRLVVPGIAGRAMALAMLGTPLALALGIPVGSELGRLLSWQGAFLATSAAAALVLALGFYAFPSIPGESGGAKRRSVAAVVALPGLVSVLTATALYATAHNLVYTYLPSLIQYRQDLSLQGLLLAFGAGAVLGLMGVGRTVDRRLGGLARLTLVALAVILALVTFLPILRPLPAGVLAVAWGLVFGGAPTIFQTASARICGESQDVGQALVVTMWNLCVAVAGVIGGVIVDSDRLVWLTLVAAGLSALGLVAANLGGFDSRGHRRRRGSHASARRGARHGLPR